VNPPSLEEHGFMPPAEYEKLHEQRQQAQARGA